MDTAYEEQLAKVLTPVSPPRVLDDVYTEDQYRRMLGVIQREGPWPTTSKPSTR